MELAGLLALEGWLSTFHTLPMRCPMTLRCGWNGSSIQIGIETTRESATAIRNGLYQLYPEAEIREVPVNQPMELEVTRFLRLERPGVWPLRRYSQLVDPVTREVVEPLSGVWDALQSGCEAGSRVDLRFTLKPKDDRFRRQATQALYQLGPREFERAEGVTDRFLEWSWGPGWKRWLFRPFAGLYWRRIPLPKEAPLRATDPTSLSTHERESLLDAAISKMQRHLFEVCIELRVTGLEKQRAEVFLKQLAAAFAPFDLPHSNRLVLSKKPKWSVLSTEELATLWHLPTKPLLGLSFEQQKMKVLPPPETLPVGKSAIVLGETLFRSERRLVSLDESQRMRHLWVVGKTGMGKTTCLANMILSDMEQGRGLAVLEPHGDLIEDILLKIPPERTNDVILFDPSDPCPPSFNPLDVPKSQAALATDGIVSSFKKLFAEGDYGSWGPQLEDILRHGVMALIEAGGTTLADLRKMLADESEFRNGILSRVRDEHVLSWWREDFPALQRKIKDNPFASVKNKLNKLLSPSVRAILCQKKGKLRLADVLVDGKILLAKLSKGAVGADTSSFLGSLLIAQLELAVMSRSGIAEKRRQPFYLYVDEAQNFITSSLTGLLSEGRKFGVGLTIANQFVNQLPDSLQHSLLGNVGTILTLQVGAEDAQLLSRQMPGNNLLPDDLVSLPPFTACVRTEVAGHTTPPFTVRTQPPSIRFIDRKRRNTIRVRSRKRYGTGG